MKYLITLLFVISQIMGSFGQSLDESLKKVSDDLAKKIFEKHINRVGLLDFLNEQKKQDAIVAYIQEQVEMNLINADGLEVLDRIHINQLLSENKRVSEGIIDESTVKKAVSFLKVDAWVRGEITNFGDKLKIKLSVVNLNTSQIFAAYAVSIDNSETLKIMAPKPCYFCKGSGTIVRKITCESCKGTGGDKCTSCGGSGDDFISKGMGGNAKCPTCKGAGKIICQVCRGKGQTTANFTCAKCNGSGKQL